MDIEKKSDQYAGRLREVYEQGRNSTQVSYPEKYPFSAPAQSVGHSIGAQLRMIARLISGGCRTKIYLARIGGFDTHAGQVESYDTTMGTHASLLYHLATSLRAFQDDLKAQGLEDRVLTVTMSEFGRRPASNGSWGTDHGTAAPMLVVGKHVNPGIIGESPDLTQLMHHNLPVRHDYRQVFGAIVQDWFASDQRILEATRFAPYVAGAQKLPIVRDYLLGNVAETFADHRTILYDCVPNPANALVQLSFCLHTRSYAALAVYDLQNKLVQQVISQVMTPGVHHRTMDVSAWAKGVYVCVLKTENFRRQKKLIVV